MLDMLLNQMGVNPKEMMKFASDLQKGVADVEAKLTAIQTSQERIEKAIADFKTKGTANE